MEGSSGRFLTANVWHSCFALILKKPYTPKKKCKVTEKHTKWLAVQSKAVWKAFNSALLFQNSLCCFPPGPRLPLLACATAPTASPHIFCCWVTVGPVPLLLHRVHVVLYRTNKCGSPWHSSTTVLQLLKYIFHCPWEREKCFPLFEEYDYFKCETPGPCLSLRLVVCKMLCTFECFFSFSNCCAYSAFLLIRIYGVPSQPPRKGGTCITTFAAFVRNEARTPQVATFPCWLFLEPYFFLSCFFPEH